MKKIIFVAICLTSIKCYGQITIGSEISPRKYILKNRNIVKSESLKIDTGQVVRQLVVNVFSYQKVMFDVKVHTPKHRIFITDTLGNILFSLMKNNGHYEYITGPSAFPFIIYDLAYDKVKEAVTTGPVDNFHATIDFVRNQKLIDDHVKVTAILLNKKIDLKNQNFVRFLHLGITEKYVLRPITIGLSKVTSVSIRTEPESQIIDQSFEKKLITDTSTYNLLKRYVFSNEVNLQKDTSGITHYIGDYKVDIDYQHKYYLNKKNSAAFFSGLVIYLRKNQCDPKVLTEVEFIANYLNNFK